MPNTEQIRSFYKDKVVLIIGAAGGIGSVVARQIASYGARLALVGRRLESLQGISEVLPGSAAFSMDITVDESIKQTIAAIYNKLGSIDIAINLAGYDICKPFDDFSRSEIRNITATNFEGCVTLTSALLPKMIARGSGTIVQINGFAAGRLAMPYFALDAGARAGIAVFSRALNRELKGTGVKLVVFAPSGTDTAAERKRAMLWDTAGISLESPEKIAQGLVLGLAQGKDQICLAGLGERLLAMVELFSPTVADTLFWNRFIAQLRPIFQSQISDK
jgi:short-subunit dehydrogenase